MELGVAGKMALVFGASKGLGKGCAMVLAAEGAKLVIMAGQAATIAVLSDL